MGGCPRVMLVIGMVAVLGGGFLAMYGALGVGEYYHYKVTGTRGGANGTATSEEAFFGLKKTCVHRAGVLSNCRDRVAYFDGLGSGRMCRNQTEPTAAQSKTRTLLQYWLGVVGPCLGGVSVLIALVGCCVQHCCLRLLASLFSTLAAAGVASSMGLFYTFFAQCGGSFCRYVEDELEASLFPGMRGATSVTSSCKVGLSAYLCGTAAILLFFGGAFITSGMGSLQKDKDKRKQIDEMEMQLRR
jgi:hypothetical protein